MIIKLIMKEQAAIQSAGLGTMAVFCTNIIISKHNATIPMTRIDDKNRDCWRAAGSVTRA
jgi:hypothetical protein